MSDGEHHAHVGVYYGVEIDAAVAVIEARQAREAEEKRLNEAHWAKVLERERKGLNECIYKLGLIVSSSKFIKADFDNVVSYLEYVDERLER